MHPRAVSGRSGLVLVNLRGPKVDGIPCVWAKASPQIPYKYLYKENEVMLYKKPGQIDLFSKASPQIP
jgi:hypothetical protein